jgi:hypothetical protein
MSCEYNTLWGQFYHYSHLYPIIIPAFIIAFSLRRDGKVEFSLALFSYWLTFMWLLILILQVGIGAQRPNPYCPTQIEYVFPSLPIFYVVSLFTYVLVATYLWKVQVSVSYWIVLMALTILPIVLNVRFAVNSTVEVVAAVLLGFISTLFFVLLFYGLIEPYSAELLKSWPWSAMQMTHSEKL